MQRGDQQFLVWLGHALMSMPPSTQITWPVIRSERSEKRNAAIAPTSRGSPSRRAGGHREHSLPKPFRPVACCRIGEFQTR